MQHLDSLKELSERARACTNNDYRAVLIQSHIDLANALDRLYREPTAAHLRDVQCAWAFAGRVFRGAPPEADPQPPLAGAPAAAILAA